jgi:L-aspartate oxidase
MQEQLKRHPNKVSELPPAAGYSNGPVPVPVETAVAQIQALMWNHAGIVRTGSGLRQAIRELEELAHQLPRPRTRREFEARNLQLNGLLVARSALAREESRGAHYRTDYPDHDDARFHKHSVVIQEKIRFE